MHELGQRAQRDALDRVLRQIVFMITELCRDPYLDKHLLLFRLKQRVSFSAEIFGDGLLECWVDVDFEMLSETYTKLAQQCPPKIRAGGFLQLF